MLVGATVVVRVEVTVAVVVKDGHTGQVVVVLGDFGGGGGGAAATRPTTVSTRREEMNFMVADR